MKRKISLFLRDILQCMEDAQSFIEGFTFEAFTRDKRTQYAVFRALEVMGEAAKHIDSAIPKFPGARLPACVTS